MSYLKFEYSPLRFAYWRVLFGTFLLFYSLRVTPYVLELYSESGPLGQYYGVSRRSSSWFQFPGLLLISSSEIWVLFIHALQIALCFLFLIGYKRRLISLLLWYIMASFYNKNPMTYSIELPYHGWILLSCALIPEGESLSRRNCQPDWRFPPVLYWGAWLLVGFAYSYAGYSKFFTPRWWEGGASYAILQSYHGYTWFQSFLPLISSSLFTFIDKAFVLTEFLAAPFYFIKRLRPAAWLITLSMHIPILFMMDVTQISLGMILIHFFIFDEQWLQLFKKS